MLQPASRLYEHWYDTNNSKMYFLFPFLSAGKLLFSCLEIDYFPVEIYAPDQNDSTDSIPCKWYNQENVILWTKCTAKYFLAKGLRNCIAFLDSLFLLLDFFFKLEHLSCFPKHKNESFSNFFFRSMFVRVQFYSMSIVKL